MDRHGTKSVFRALKLSGSRAAKKLRALCPRLSRQATLASLLGFLGISAVLANQIPTGSFNATAFVIKTYAGGSTRFETRYNSPVTATSSIAVPQTPLNSDGGITAAQISPTIAPTTDSVGFEVIAEGCDPAVRCNNRGTVEIVFRRQVKDPVLHISGLGGNSRGDVFFHTALVMTSFVGQAQPTFTVQSGSLTASGTEIRSTNINGQTQCSAGAGCGSVKINGLVSSVTFQMDLIMGGSGRISRGSADTFNMTVSIDEDYGDLPASYEQGTAAVNLVGGVFMGSGVTPDNVNTSNDGTIAVSPIASVNADGDTDDGVSIDPIVFLNQQISIDIPVQSGGNTASLYAWIDWNRDGVFSNTLAERIVTNVTDGGNRDADGVVNGSIRAEFDVPATASIGRTYGRFRYEEIAGQSRLPNGISVVGETEDISFEVSNAVTEDLELTLQSPASTFAGAGTSIEQTYTLVNNSNNGASTTNVQVQLTPDPAFSFGSASPSVGSYNSSTNIWTIPSIFAGTSRDLTITWITNATVGQTFTTTAEIIASDSPDADSTPNNGVTTEDDYVSQNITVVASNSTPPPPLTCSTTPTILDWDNYTWTNGQTSNSYNVPSLGNVAVTLTPPAGGNTLVETNTLNTGGLSPVETGLYIEHDFTTKTAQSVTNILFPQVIGGTQFTIFDVDRQGTTSGWEDRITVLGFNGASVVSPILSDGVANAISGNSAIGTATAANQTDQGDATVTFDQPIDRIRITYGSGPGAPSNPVNQAVTIHDLIICTSSVVSGPVIGLTKVSGILADPINGTNQPLAIPGALIEYTIAVNNSGTGSTDADSVIITDNIPAETKLCLTDLGGSGPVQFLDGSPSSGLTYTYTSLTDSSDDLAFSNDNGVTFSYSPVQDADGCDAAITNFRLNPSGAFAVSSQLTLKARFRLK